MNLPNPVTTVPERPAGRRLPAFSQFNGRAANEIAGRARTRTTSTHPPPIGLHSLIARSVVSMTAAPNSSLSILKLGVRAYLNGGNT